MILTNNIVLLCASQTGNAEDVSEDVINRLGDAGYEIKLIDLCYESDPAQLRNASCILGVVSTWGEGEPPDDAVPFFENLNDSEFLGLVDTKISILGLGDTGYELFCECGKMLERELQRHGASILLPRIDCDVWYDDEIDKWVSELQNVFRQNTPLSATT